MNVIRVRKKKRKPYPWKKWFAMGRIKLKKGIHFKVETYIMAQMVRNKAVLYGKKVSIKLDTAKGMYLIVKVVGDKDEETPTDSKGKAKRKTA